MDIKIVVNEQEITVPEGTTVSELLELLNYSTRAAVWIADEQLLRGEYQRRRLLKGDAIKIRRLVAGG